MSGTPVESQVCWCVSLIPVVGRWRQQDSRAYWPANLEEPASSQFTENSEIKVGSICTHTCVCAYIVHIHTAVKSIWKNDQTKSVVYNRKANNLPPYKLPSLFYHFCKFIFYISEFSLKEATLPNKYLKSPECAKIWEVWKEQCSWSEKHPAPCALVLKAVLAAGCHTAIVVTAEIVKGLTFICSFWLILLELSISF